MNCPTCTGTALVAMDRQGIEIDVCPACRGVWLDRGELDKIVARSMRRDPDRDDDDDFDDEPRRRSGGGDYHPPSRRRSWWTELFD